MPGFSVMACLDWMGRLAVLLQALFYQPPVLWYEREPLSRFAGTKFRRFAMKFSDSFRRLMILVWCAMQT